MSKEKDGQDPTDELSISAVFVISGNGDSPEREARRTQRDHIDGYLVRQAICGRRADVRNSFRSWIEQSPKLSRFFGLPAIHSMTAQEIFHEESFLHERVLRRLAHKERDIHPVRTLAHASKGPSLYVDEETLQRQEKAKYNASRMKRYIDVKRFRDARAVDAKAKNTVKTRAEEEYMETVTGFVAIDGVRKCLQEEDATHVVEAIFELGAVTNFKPEDFSDLPDEVLKNPKIVEAIQKKLGEFAELHPKYYATVRDYFVSIGLMEADAANHSKYVLNGSKKLLNQAMVEHPTAFAKFRDMLDEMGILSKEDSNALPDIQAKVRSRLAYEMAMSPDLYIFHRDKMVRLGIVRAEDCDKDPEIRKRFLGHLLSWKDVHVSLFGKFRFHWAKNGLIEPKAKELGITEVDARVLAHEHGGTFNQVSFEGYDAEAIGNAACSVFKAELSRVEGLLNSSAPFIEKQSLEKVVENAMYHARNVFARYPQVIGKDFKFKDLTLEQ